MQVTVSFYSHLRDLTGCSDAIEALPDGSTLGDLLERMIARFPRLNAMRKSILTAVGVEYQDRTYVLNDGDEVALFPPVQGG